MREGGKAVCVYTGGGKEGEAGRSGSGTGRSHSSCVSFSCSGRGGAAFGFGGWVGGSPSPPLCLDLRLREGGKVESQELKPVQVSGL